MTGSELQSRVVRRIERHYDRAVATHRAHGIDDHYAHALAMQGALRQLAEALEELRGRGLFPFPEGEIKRTVSGGGHA